MHSLLVLFYKHSSVIIYCILYCTLGYIFCSLALPRLATVGQDDRQPYSLTTTSPLQHSLLTSHLSPLTVTVTHYTRPYPSWPKTNTLALRLATRTHRWLPPQPQPQPQFNHHHITTGKKPSPIHRFSHHPQYQATTVQAQVTPPPPTQIEPTNSATQPHSGPQSYHHQPSGTKCTPTTSDPYSRVNSTAS